MNLSLKVIFSYVFVCVILSKVIFKSFCLRSFYVFFPPKVHIFKSFCLKLFHLKSFKLFCLWSCCQLHICYTQSHCLKTIMKITSILVETVNVFGPKIPVSMIGFYKICTFEICSLRYVSLKYNIYHNI
jgi:hypothetical protein